MSLKFPSPPFTHSHFHFPTVVESSLSHYSYSSPNNMAGCPAVAGDTTATAAVWVALSCCRITHLATRHLFASQKQHLEGCRLNRNEKVEMVVRDWLRITRDGFLPCPEFKLMPRWGKYISELGYSVGRQLYFREINEL